MPDATDAEPRNWEAIDEAIRVLNRVHAADPSVLTELIELRVSCNDAVADDPTVQVQSTNNGPWMVGLLGILNGVFGVDASNTGYIAADRNKQTGEVLGFSWHKAEVQG